MPSKIDLTGQRFGRLLVIREATEEEKQGRKGVFWYCKCDCGEIKITRTHSLRCGETQSCGCYNKMRVAETQHASITDMTGQRYGRLTVLYYDETRKPGETYWVCKCDCGNIVSILRDSLIHGDTISCGCYRKEVAAKRMRELSANNYIDETGKIYGKLKVVRKATLEEDNFVAPYGGVWWVCNCECGKTIIVSGNYLRFSNYPSCGCLKSKGEFEICNILEANNFSYMREFKVKKSIESNEKWGLRFDFAVHTEKCWFYFIEFDGKQHFVPVDRFGGKEYYEKVKEHDEWKNNFCIEHHIPLIRIPYTQIGKITLNDILPDKSNFLYKEN